jgi:hypothetical protein
MTSTIPITVRLVLLWTTLHLFLHTSSHIEDVKPEVGEEERDLTEEVGNVVVDRALCFRFRRWF